MRVAVVISTWSGNPASYLLSLCSSMAQHPSGFEHQLFLSANGTEYVVPREIQPLFAETFIRDNTGYNLGAWDYAWRRLPDHDRFLFLQDDCVVRKDDWLLRFIERFDSIPRCGLVGENLIRYWNRPWSELSGPRAPVEKDDHRVAAVKFYRETLSRWGIPEGATARHLTTVVQFTSRSILEEVNGYNPGQTKGQAIAAEIGFSRKIESKGYTLAQLARRSHSVIVHRQWPSGGFLSRLKRSIRKRFGKGQGIREGKR